MAISSMAASQILGASWNPRDCKLPALSIADTSQGRNQITHSMLLFQDAARQRIVRHSSCLDLSI